MKGKTQMIISIDTLKKTFDKTISIYAKNWRK